MIEKISHIDMKVRWSPVLLEVNLIFILKECIKTWNHDFQPCKFYRDGLFEEVLPISSGRQITPYHYSCKIGVLFFNDTWVLVSPVQTIMPINCDIKLKVDLSDQTNLPFVTFVQEPLTKLLSPIWFVLI